MSRVLVIGGGAAGMMSALTAAECGENVILLEKNEKLGKKLFITGKGRCNVTNNCPDNEFFDSVNSNSKFLYSSIYGFDSYMTMDLFEKYGCSLKVERGGRVFPVSDHSSDVIKALEKGLLNNGVEIRKNTFVKDITVEEGIAKGVVLKNGERLPGDKIILCSGGCSYSSTGSDGYFTNILKKYGHTFSELRPGLVPFECEEHFCKDLMGLSLKNVSLNLEIEGKNIYSGFGEMLFTHFGISGPLVLTASSVYSGKYFGRKCKAYIDLKPALNHEKLDERVLRDFNENNNRQFKNVLEGLLPKRLAQLVPELIGVSGDKKINFITAQEREKLVGFLKNFELNVTGLRDFNEAIITIGGINVKEVNPSNMESKIVKNLYFAGEILDVDAYTGGFNLQIAWSTARAAGTL